MLKFNEIKRMKKIFSVIVMLGLTGFCFAQSPVKEELRMQQAEKMFKNTLIQYFIHPDQIEKESWVECRLFIKNLLEKYPEDFIAIKIEQAYKSADVTNYFSPIFIYADGKKFRLPAFKTMQ